MAETSVDAACAVTLRDLDYNQYLSSLFADGQDRPALVALHSFNAELGRIRESVTEPMLGEIRLTWWREAIESLADGAVRKHPVIEALAAPVKDARIDPGALFGMIEARIADVYEDAPKDDAALTHYAKETGGAVMAQAMRIAGGDGGQQALASQLGTAMTRGGIARSIGFHAAMRRIHLPQEDLAAMGLTADALFQGEFTPEIAALAKRLGDDALAQVRGALSKRMTRRQRKAMVPAIFALDDLSRASRKGFDPQQSVSEVSTAAKIAKSWWYGLTGRA